MPDKNGHAFGPHSGLCLNCGCSERGIFFEGPAGRPCPNAPAESPEAAPAITITTMKRFVLMFLFDPTLTKVVCIRKNRPDWMAGKLNVPGGHVEESESDASAASREFFEETGLQFPQQKWQYFLRFNTHNWNGEMVTLACFWGVSADFASVKTMEDEVVSIHDIQSLVGCSVVVKDTLWVLLMAQEFARRHPEDNMFRVVIETPIDMERL